MNKISDKMDSSAKCKRRGKEGEYESFDYKNKR